MAKALIIVDLQKDFLPGGALAVTDGDQVLPVINRLLQYPFDLVVATGDWHPRGHWSFASTHGKAMGDVVQLPDGSSQILWPDHCIQHTEGAEFSEIIDLKNVHIVTHKGTDRQIDSYSVFFDNGHVKRTELDESLKQHAIDTLFLAGLATDYCVKYSALDALKLGFNCYVVIDGCKAVNLQPDDEEKALQQMKAAGAKLIYSREINEFMAKDSARDRQQPNQR